MELVVSRRVCGDTKSWSFHCNWDEKDFWWLNFQILMWIGWFIAYLNPKISALVWVYQWFLHPISKPQALYKLHYYHLPWIKFQISNTCAYSVINMFYLFWESWRHSALLWSEIYWSKVGSKTMGIRMMVHLNGRLPPNNLVLIFIYFINYPTFACIDIKYRPLYIFIGDKVCYSSICNEVP